MQPSLAEPTDADAALLTRAAGGDRAAFGDLVGRYRDPLFRYLRALVRSEELAEEALQEVMVGVWRGAGAWRGEGSPRVWLFGMARRQAARTWRRRVGEPLDTVPLEVLGQAAGFGRDPERLVSEAEDLERLERALATLADDDREVVILRDVEGLTGPEAADVTGLPLATLKTRLHRARLRLMAALGAMDGGLDGG